MRNLTPDRAFRLKKQSIFELNFIDESKSNKIHSKQIHTQPTDSLFQAYTKNRVLKLKEAHNAHSRIQHLKTKLIKIFKDSRQQSPHDVFTDNQGKKILEELKESHILNLQGLQRIMNNNEQTSFFLNQPRNSSVLRKCYYRFPTDAIDRLDRSTTANTPQPLMRRYTPILKPRVRRSEQWSELNAWQTKEESTTNLF